MSVSRSIAEIPDPYGQNRSLKQPWNRRSNYRFPEAPLRGTGAIDFARDAGGLTRALHYQVASHIAAGDLSIVLSALEPDPPPYTRSTQRMPAARARAGVRGAGTGAGRDVAAC